MKALKKLIALLSLAMFSASTFAITDDQMFAFAEANYPSIFTGTATAGVSPPYNYRYYPASQNYLAVDTSGVIFIMGPYTGGVVTAIGPVTDYAAAITAWEATQVRKLLYACPQAICSWDMATQTQTVLWGQNNVWPDTIVPARTGGMVAFQGSNLGGIMSMSLSTLSPKQMTWGNWTEGCSSWAEGSFDLTPSGDIVVFSSKCFPIGFPEKRDIVLMKMDGTMSWIRVTDDEYRETSPAIGGVDAMGNITVLFVSDRDGATGIWKQVVSTQADDSGAVPQTLIVSNVLDETTLAIIPSGTRAISVNQTYDKMAFMKNVGGIPHITVIPLVGGAEVDLGPGMGPYWAVDGSNRILYTDYEYKSLWAVNPDGTNRMQITTPSNARSCKTCPINYGSFVFSPE